MHFQSCIFLWQNIFPEIAKKQQHEFNKIFNRKFFSFLFDFYQIQDIWNQIRKPAGLREIPETPGKHTSVLRYLNKYGSRKIYTI